MRFKIVLHKKAAKFLKGLDSKTKEKIKEKIKILESFPKINADILKISGEPNVFRLRIGNYRVLFKIYEHEQIIFVLKIDKRSRVYRYL